ncbi:DUF3747 domain-containing protein [Leptothoe kymatousa]|uniref:DUF3747 domain-containing protein n=1 Tax=Leptothoe kymatousa TAU-MAC 1615 TaxID=2364775 RepID=A0ABS5Y356_9CYAN|nr:DUF3747 domain-containing protein [Leptothoe kymatousa]MBT9312279.1 DUF3747 domain-containing protein [Leptothoe kymatousa TAU-MAC 1615]
MKSLLRQLTTLSAVAATFGAAITLPSSASAAQFNQQSIDSNRVVAVAEPINNGRFFKLLIIEQVSSARRCWQEQPGTPTTINPLLLNFDFTGICGRSSDSNGYSVRIGGEDLGSRYRLQIENRGDSLVLVAAPSPLQRGLPKLELGRSQGIANDFVKIELNAGWSMARRVYNGQTLGHTYLTNNQSLDAVLASVGATRPDPPTSRPTPTRPSPLPLPTPPSNRPQLPPPTIGTPGNNRNIDYQVVVPGSSAILRSRVNAVEPGAFRTTANGQTVIQAGRFREQSRANELRQRLVQAGLSAQILETGRVSAPPRTAPPAGDIIYQVIVPGSSSLLRARVNRIESGAFRTTVNGQTVIQAGRFREQVRANNLRQRLQADGLDAQILQTTAAAQPPATPSPGTLPRPAQRGEVLVMIDPGHGGRDPGAVGNGLQEKEINLFISRRVKRTLEQRGYRVAMTRNSDVEIDLQPRVNIAERANATVFVSIHSNAISLSRPEVNGLETYYFSSGRSLARSIHNSVLRSSDLRDRGVRQARFYVLRNTSMPAVLVETGFITGREDSARFRSNAAREQIADAIAQGVIDYLR